MQPHLIDAFQTYFQMVPALTDELKDAVYRLRYQIYCLETHFENPEDFPDGVEKDQYDDHSLHYLIRHRRSGYYAATTRLILPDLGNINKPFPIEQNCRIDSQSIIRRIPRARLAEISRFAVSKGFKRRSGEAVTVSGKNNKAELRFSGAERRVFPHITLALFACINQMCLTREIDYLYAVMEPALLRFLNSLNVVFVPIGPPTNYHGLRQPCLANVEEILGSVLEKNHQVWDLLTNRGQFDKDTAPRYAQRHRTKRRLSIGHSTL